MHTVRNPCFQITWQRQRQLDLMHSHNEVITFIGFYFVSLSRGASVSERTQTWLGYMANSNEMFTHLIVKVFLLRSAYERFLKPGLGIFRLAGTDRWGLGSRTRLVNMAWATYSIDARTCRREQPYTQCIHRSTEPSVPARIFNIMWKKSVLRHYFDGRECLR
jgi:hypothetical protein